MKNIFIVYPYYWPDFKAGGPIQSIINLVRLFSSRHHFFVTSTFAQKENKNYSLRWNEWNVGPHGEQVFVSDYISPFKMYSLLKRNKPDLVYINGIFNANTTLPALFFGYISGTKTIVSPRGMLKNWALEKKAFKKSIYLKLFKALLSESTIWHATNLQEESEIKYIIGSNIKVYVADNIPRTPQVKPLVKPKLKEESLKLVFLSLINSNKQLDIIIEAVKSIKSGVMLDIYGPVADEKYWTRCVGLMGVDSNISYKGAVSPENVPRVLSNYHFFVLPTLGENFGHAIFDALSVGLPVIISKNTPWKNLDAAYAGLYLNELTALELNSTIEVLKHVSFEKHRTLSRGALSYAVDYVNSQNYTEAYHFLMS